MGRNSRGFLKKQSFTACFVLISLVSLELSKAYAREVSLEELKTSNLHKIADKTTEVCEVFFSRFDAHVPEPLKKPLTFVGYVSGVIPTSKMLSDPDKIFFTLIETPITGLITTPASVIVAGLLTGNGVHFDAAFLRDAWEVYWTFQVSNAIRNGVSLDTNLSLSARTWLNWWFSASINSLGTAGDRLAQATTEKAAEHAYSLIAYSMSFPLFSQQVSQRVFTPLLFSKFPKKSVLDQVKNPLKTTAHLLEAQQFIIDDAEKEIARIKENPDDVKNHLAEIRRLEEMKLSARFSKGWIEWFRKGHLDGETLAPHREAQYWAMKTGVSMSVAVFMVTLYYIGRWELLGKDEDGDGVLKQMVRFAMRELSADTQKKYGEPSFRDLAEEDLKDAVAAVKQLLKQYHRGEFWSNIPPLALDPVQKK